MTTDSPPTAHHVAIIGGGPAGLMAAEVLAQGGVLDQPRAKGYEVPRGRVPRSYFMQRCGL